MNKVKKGIARKEGENPRRYMHSKLKELRAKGKLNVDKFMSVLFEVYGKELDRMGK